MTPGTLRLKILALFATALLSSCGQKIQEGANVPATYTVIWKYVVQDSTRRTFEQEYGTNGTWYKLFSKSPNYRGSVLHRSDEHPDTYILIDKWTSKEAYEAFKKSNAEVYGSLSKKFEGLYTEETKIGGFQSLE